MERKKIPPEHQKIPLETVGMDEKTGARIWTFFTATQKAARKHMSEMRTDRPRTFWNPLQQRRENGRK